MTRHKLTGIAWQVLAYFLAITLAWQSYVLFPDWNIITKFFLANVVGTGIIFFFSRVSSNSSFYDPYWSVQPIVIATALAIMQDQSMSTRQLAVLILVWAYGLRLTFNFLRGWDGLSEQDWRYDDLKKKHGRLYWLVSFAGIHFFPTILVFGGCLSLFVVFEYVNQSWGFIDFAALTLTVVAIVVEAIADQQLYAFRRAVRPPEAILSSGLWKYVRFPNYLGEICFWWGLYLFALSANISYAWVLIGPLAIHLLFIYISIPMKDERMLEKRPGYADHMDKIPALWPRLGK